MTINTPTVKTYDLLPETAPFSLDQRAWLSGFFAGYLKLDTNAVTALAPGDVDALLNPASEAQDTPWHDPAMAIEERLKLAEGRPTSHKLFAAMAQQNCGQCGYQCETYSAAIASGAEARLNLCAPGGKETLRALKTLVEQNTSTLVAPAAQPSPSSQLPSRENPSEVVFLSRRKLNSALSEKVTYHIEFDLAGSGLSYEAGDSLGLFAWNDPRLVDAIIALMGARPDAPLGERNFRDVLIKERSLGPAPDALFQLISFVTGGVQRQKAQALAKGEDPDGDAALLDVLGTLHKFSGLKLSPEAFVEALDAIQPRLYSISSSPKHQPDRLSLTVDCVHYRLGRRERFGLASNFLAERTEPGAKLKAYIQKAHAFALPDDPDKPIIMVGPGTGIAPFRAFLQERIATTAPGRNWLFFGHQRQASDFFYADELNEMKSAGHLQRLSLAWSRDGSQKIYVQDRMRDNGAELWAWLKDGAHFYVCGDAKRMAKDVERALVDIIAEHGHMTSDIAVQFVASLKKAGRYQADVY